MKLRTIWTVEKTEVGRVREEKSRSEKIRYGESQKKEDAGARKGREVAIHCVFPMVWGSGGPKSNLAKAAGAETAGQMRDEKLHAAVARSHISKSKCTKHANVGALLEVQPLKKYTPLRCKAHFQAKSVKNPQSQTTFGS